MEHQRRLASSAARQGLEQKGPEMKEQMKEEEEEAGQPASQPASGRTAVLFVLARDPKLVARYNNSSSINAGTTLVHWLSKPESGPLNGEQVSNGAATLVFPLPPPPLHRYISAESVVAR